MRTVDLPAFMRGLGHIPGRVSITIRTDTGAIVGATADLESNTVGVGVQSQYNGRLVSWRDCPFVGWYVGDPELQPEGRPSRQMVSRWLTASEIAEVCGR